MFFFFLLSWTSFFADRLPESSSSRRQLIEATYSPDNVFIGLYLHAIHLFIHKSANQQIVTAEARENATWMNFIRFISLYLRYVLAIEKNFPHCYKNSSHHYENSSHHQNLFLTIKSWRRIDVGSEVREWGLRVFMAVLNEFLSQLMKSIEIQPGWNVSQLKVQV